VNKLYRKNTKVGTPFPGLPFAKCQLLTLFRSRVRVTHGTDTDRQTDRQTDNGHQCI